MTMAQHRIDRVCKLMFLLFACWQSQMETGRVSSLSIESAAATTRTKPQLGINISRRSAFGIVVSSVGAAVTLPMPAFGVAPAFASDETTTFISATSTSTPERDALLSAIASGANNEKVLQALQNLIPLDPSKGRAATLEDQLEGQWKLLWSIKAEAFSPLLQLPPPFRPMSYQYLGKAAAQEVGGPNRVVAQGLTGGILGSNRQLWLSSGVEPSAEDPSVLDILPPFRFQIGGTYGSGEKKRTIVESETDADFRKNVINSRSEQAQLAPRNKYQQVYLESSGVSGGALRISTIISGDPVIVGAMFVHQKL
jgi:hypothetical protein